MTAARDRLFNEFAGTPGSDEHELFMQLYYESVDAVLYWRAEQLRGRAREIEERYEGKRGEIYKLYRAQADAFRRAADTIDPFVEANGLLYRKRDNRIIAL